jgi:hypothetical protein
VLKRRRPQGLRRKDLVEFVIRVEIKLTDYQRSLVAKSIRLEVTLWEEIAKNALGSFGSEDLTSSSSRFLPWTPKHTLRLAQLSLGAAK